MIGLLRVIAVTVLFLVFTNQAIAQDEPGGCEGLTAYGDAIMAAAADYGEFLQTDNLLARDPLTVSATEWTALADHADAVQTALKAIEPPPALADWHQYEIQVFGFQSTLARTLAHDGIVVGSELAQGETAQRLNADGPIIRQAAITACPGFADIYTDWDMLDGVAEPADASS